MPVPNWIWNRVNESVQMPWMKWIFENQELADDIEIDVLADRVTRLQLRMLSKQSMKKWKEKQDGL